MNTGSEMRDKEQLLCIMLSNTANGNYRAMTNNALNTLYEKAGHPNLEIKCILVETNIDSEPYKQPWVKTIYPKREFNYNSFINDGYELAQVFWPEFFAENNEKKYVAVFNNDLIFEDNWAQEIIAAIDKDNLNSASPRSPSWQFHQNYTIHSINGGIFHGWGIGYEFTGWAIIFKKESYDKLHPLDERFLFWCQDLDITIRMQHMKMEHALVSSSIVHHLTSSSHRLIPDGKHHHFTEGMAELYRQKCQNGEYEKN